MLLAQVVKDRRFPQGINDFQRLVLLEVSYANGEPSTDYVHWLQFAEVVEDFKFRLKLR